MNRERPGGDTPSPLGLTSNAGGALASKKFAACHACRDRKTRCVGFPICQYCARSNLVCSRTEEQPVTPLDQWGQQIIDAIHNAKQELISASSASATSPHHFAPAQRQNPNPDVPELSSLGIHHRSRSGGRMVTAFPHELVVTPDPQDLTSTVVLSKAEAILTWPVWRLSPSEISSLLSEPSPPEAPKADDATSSSANTSLEELKRWQLSFAHRFLGSYPIVDTAELRHLTTITAEKGPGWNSSTCLLLLTCALGAQCRPNTPASQASRDPGQRYWSMAKRRLGWAMDENSLVSTQCMALAGLWHLHNFEPYKARKMLFLAICFAQPLVSSDRPGVFEICSSLYFKVSVGLGLPIQHTGDANRLFLPEQQNISQYSNIDSFKGSTEGERNHPQSAHDSWTSLQSIYSQCLRFNEQIPTNPTCQMLFLIFQQLLNLGLQLDNWCRNLSHELQMVLANVNGSDASQNLLQPMHAEQTEEAQEGLELIIVYREVKLLLLLPALFVILSPTLTRKLSEPSCPPFLAQQLLDRITREANACLRLAIVSIDEAAKQTRHRDLQATMQATHTSPSSQFRDNGIDVGVSAERCNHVYQWLLSSCAFRDGLVLLAGLRAYTEAMNAVSPDLTLCAGLHIPEDAKVILENLARDLLAYPESTHLWCSGRLLVRLLQDDNAMVG